MVKKRGLGRGLDALLASVNTVEEVSVESASDSDHVSSAAKDMSDGYRLMSVDVIERGRYQPRRDLEPEALEDLANSIRAQGVMQPLSYGQSKPKAVMRLSRVNAVGALLKWRV